MQAQRNVGHQTINTMKSTVLIETKTMAAYRAIRPAIVAAKVGYIGVSGLTLPPSKGVAEGRGITATIFMKDFAYLVDVVNHAAHSAGVDRDEYEIRTMHSIPPPQRGDGT